MIKLHKSYINYILPLAAFFFATNANANDKLHDSSLDYYYSISKGDGLADWITNNVEFVTDLKNKDNKISLSWEKQKRSANDDNVFKIGSINKLSNKDLLNTSFAYSADHNFSAKNAFNIEYGHIVNLSHGPFSTVIIYPRAKYAAYNSSDTYGFSLASEMYFRKHNMWLTTSLGQDYIDNKSVPNNYSIKLDYQIKDNLRIYASGSTYYEYNQNSFDKVSSVGAGVSYIANNKYKIGLSANNDNYKNLYKRNTLLVSTGILF